jgi:hypothetical protein
LSIGFSPLSNAGEFDGKSLRQQDFAVRATAGFDDSKATNAQMQLAIGRSLAEGLFILVTAGRGAKRDKRPYFPVSSPASYPSPPESRQYYGNLP